ncbi:MAG: hypothetical protein ACI855_000745 [Myxococcota bacterium]|jgi:hypothetical protein
MPSVIGAPIFHHWRLRNSVSVDIKYSERPPYTAPSLGVFNLLKDLLGPTAVVDDNHTSLSRRQSPRRSRPLTQLDVYSCTSHPKSGWTP